MAAVPDITPFFARYEALVAQADALFATILARFPAEVVCRERCSSCCYAMFDLSLVETLYLNAKFLEQVPYGAGRSALLEKADKADREAVRIKRGFFKASKTGQDSNDILQDAAAVQLRCPLLDENDLCLLYAHRPITCRVYGAPTSIGGKAHTCGKTGFVKGVQYPTINLDRIQDQLAELSLELAKALGSRFTKLHTMYLPVSSVLTTTFDAVYLGIGQPPRGGD